MKVGRGRVWEPRWTKLDCRGQGYRGSARSLESLDHRLRGNEDQEARATAFAPAPKLGAVRAEGAKGRGWRHALGPWFAQQIMGARRTLVRLVDRPLVHRHRRVVARLGQRRVGVADARPVVGGALEDRKSTRPNSSHYCAP